MGLVHITTSFSRGGGMEKVSPQKNPRPRWNPDELETANSGNSSSPILCRVTSAHAVRMDTLYR
jgi:hypothetical protein